MSFTFDLGSKVKHKTSNEYVMVVADRNIVNDNKENYLVVWVDISGHKQEDSFFVHELELVD